MAFIRSVLDVRGVSMKTVVLTCAFNEEEEVFVRGNKDKMLLQISLPSFRIQKIGYRIKL